jgi:hypothetical protein
MSRYLFLGISLCVVAVSFGDHVADDALLALHNGGQLVKIFDVEVVDAGGKPIAGVSVTPWALRSSQGHGRWRDDKEERSGMNPKASITDEQGAAKVRYPFYRDVKEQTRTFSVSLVVRHPEFATDYSIDVDVPIVDDKPHVITMLRAASITFIPQSEADNVSIDQFYLVSSDPSDSSQYPTMVRHADRLEFKPLSPGPFRGMLVRLLNDQAVEFSDPIELDLKSGSNDAISVAMHPAVSIRGRLGDEVPRPVVAGRVSAIASPRPRPLPNFDWTQWAPVDESGDFVLSGLPRSESLQVIALCDHFIARNGNDPNAKPTTSDRSDPLDGLKTMVEIAKHFTAPSIPPSTRPQVFAPDAPQPITIRMAPLVRCEIKVVNPDGKPLRNIFVGGNPNVYWWDWGSQIYGDQLMRSTEWLTGKAKVEEEPWDSDSVRGYDMPFFEHSDDKGHATLYLPPGKQELFAHAKDNGFQLPIFMGGRDRRVTVVAGETLKVTLQLEPTGSEKLGEYDKLAGVVFGCSTREGKQICALPTVREKMDDFARRLREADNPRDPAVLAEAFTVVAEAFDRAGDLLEADKWRAKADAEKAKLQR